jgi:hypothetical protein
MSPPEVWGPAIWTLFHTLADRIREDAYEFIFPSLFNIITRICKYLPCPECANDATIFLARIKHSDLRTKTQFKNTFYLFHNYVNAKKRKRLFNYSNINMYNKLKLVNVINNFINNYQTKGNMKLINESFQRQFVINDFKNFIKKYIKVFIPNIYIPKRLQPVQITSDKANELDELNELEFKNTKKQLLENIELKEDYLYKPLENEENLTKEEIEEETLQNEIKNILDEIITIIEE